MFEICNKEKGETDVKTLKDADGYFFTGISGTNEVGFSKNGVCFRIDESGEVVPIAYGDEANVILRNVVAVRRGQKIILVAGD